MISEICEGETMEEKERLARIASIIESVDNRCMAADGPVTPTLQEMTQDEISRIYALSRGMDEEWRPWHEGHIEKEFHEENPITS